jgi:hypothetical protein
MRARSQFSTQLRRRGVCSPCHRKALNSRNHAHHVAKWHINKETTVATSQSGTQFKKSGLKIIDPAPTNAVRRVWRREETKTSVGLSEQ